MPPKVTTALKPTGLDFFDPATVTGSPLASLTVARYGRLIAVRLFSVTPLTILGHLPIDHLVTDSVALPGRDGFAVTLSVSLLDLQVIVKTEPRATVTLVRLARLAVSTAPFLTAGPPFFPIVRTGLATA